MRTEREHLNEPVGAHARRDFAAFPEDLTVQLALAAIRQRGLGADIVYFYVVDSEGRLLGVVPTRRLLTAALEQSLREVMVTRVIAVPDSATLLEACELFVLHKLLAFPVIDAQRRMIGVVDVAL